MRAIIYYNKEIRRGYNIATIGSMLKTKIKLYINWANNISFAYLNNEHYIDRELAKCHYLAKLKRIIENTTENVHKEYQNYIYYNKTDSKKGIIQIIRNINEDAKLNTILNMIPTNKIEHGHVYEASRHRKTILVRNVKLSSIVVIN